MTREERTKQREEFDAASEAYERDLALYSAETAKWERAWRAAGRTPPATRRIKPEPPAQPEWGNCEHCNGCGSSDKDPIPFLFPCSACGGTGDAKAGSKSA
jgi:hypothetical protein